MKEIKMFRIENIKVKICILLFVIVTIFVFINNIIYKNTYIIVNKADSLNKGDVILRKFENLKLFKQKNKYNDKLFYNKDITVIRNFIKRNPHTFEDSTDRIESHLKYGESYDSPYLVQNYDYLPDTIIANGYHIMYASDFEVMQEYIGKQIRIMTYKYKKYSAL